MCRSLWWSGFKYLHTDSFTTLSLFFFCQRRIDGWPQAAPKGDGSQRDDSQGGDSRIDDDAQQLIEALRASNERREYEIQMMQQRLAWYDQPKWDDSGRYPQSSSSRETAAAA